MLINFEVRNYKTFNGSIGIDFSDVCGYKFNQACITNNVLSKVLIYGRNATGKTNLGGAIQDIYYTLFSLNNRRTALLNADTNGEEIFFSYKFKFGDDVLKYEYSRSEADRLLTESLFLNGDIVYKYDFSKRIMLDENLEILREGPILYERFIDSMTDELINLEDTTFLRWIYSNISLTNESHLVSLMDYINRMQFVSVQTDYFYKKDNLIQKRFFEIIENKAELKKFEEFLNAMGVECKLELKKLPDGQHALYFKHNKLVPFFETASSGTKSLVDLYRKIFLTEREPSFLYMDEFDAFYHYEMSEKLLNYMIDNYPNTQIVLTTHNTNLMSNKNLRPDCLMILSRDGRITSLTHATNRELREGHNLEKMYIAGEFQMYE
ncbi:MAG: ATP-binding protein [Pseudobutyrivibrio ruminis]|uniref:ATP-binding protein n=1 Tax=Pseudobutyrivibrio ruminis TaxID=46206 RepID=A0A927U777_9FIRM|nr:ATP-binding protein [Pseudobutyrivibrio ruminis]